MSSLRDLLKRRYLDTLRSVQSRWKILILDDHTHKMMTSVLTTYEILDEGVQQIDVITQRRSPEPRLEAVYLLMPTSENVELVLRDFNPNPPPAPSKSRKTKEVVPAQPQEGPKYGGCHLHFIDGISDDLVERVTSGLPQNYLLALTELYINFHPIESRMFSLQSPQSFFKLYAPPDKSPKESLAAWEDEIGWMSRSLVNTLATLGEYPLIRYYNPPSGFHPPLGPGQAVGEHIGKRLAERVQAEMDAYARDNSDFPPTPDPPRPRGVLLITDRSMDLFAPFLHEFTYQSMCNDLLDIEDGRIYRYQFQNAQGATEDKEAILSEDDKVWTDVRHMHMKDALDKLIADFKAYAGEHGGKFGAEGGTSLNDMKDMLASLPQLREAKDKLSLHLTMAEKCMALFEKKKLPLSASVEQCCATGVTPEGKTPKTLVEEMVPLLDDRSVSSVDKLRIIAMYIMHRDGVPEGDKKRLYQHARLALHEMDAVNNLTYLGVAVSKDSGKKRKPLFKQREEDDAYDISRYQPLLKYLLEEHIAGTLDQTNFPYVRDAPVAAGSRSSASSAPTTQGSLRSARPQWTSSRVKKVANEPRQRVLVFMAGGMTYSEIRAAYKVSEAANKDIFIGSTNVFTPASFVADLSNLDRGAGASLAPTHGAPAATSFVAPKKGKVAPPPTSTYGQGSIDRRFGSASAAPPPPQQQQRPQAAPPPSGYGRSPPPQSGYGSPPSNQNGRGSYHDPYQGQGSQRGSYHSTHSAPPPQQQQQYRQQPPPPQQGYYQQGPPPPQMQMQPPQQHARYAPSGSSSVHSAHSSPGGSMMSGAPAEVEKKKKKKLFGF